MTTTPRQSFFAQLVESCNVPWWMTALDVVILLSMPSRQILTIRGRCCADA
ncbi:MAG: hypothetical protein RI601_12450 [Desulfurivibrionaceae bacterium]|nr:hypothetical protein [Desulfurivibrionaceae bacterium]